MANQANISLQFSRLYLEPLDKDFVFNNSSDRTAFINNPSTKYEGLITYDKAEKKVYVLKNNSGSWSWVELAQGSGNYQTASNNLTSLSGLTWSSGSPFIKMTGVSTFTFDTTSYQPLDDDLTAIAALSGTSGLLKKTAINTWSLDTSSYALSSSIPTKVSELSNDSGYITSASATGAYLPITATSSSAGATNITLDFTIADNIYGTIADPVSGDITFGSFTSAKRGVTHIVIHRHMSTVPSIAGTKLSGSGNYKTGVYNYIYFTYLGGSTVIYSINQGV